jgi:CheY-like chemotaxis protein
MASVLVIDDEAPIVDLLAEIIEERGHDVLRASNGANGLAIARSERPQLIISDVMMPLLDGYALLRALRAEPELAHISVVLVSAGFPKQEPPQTNPPADGYLHKPFDIAAIEHLLDTLPLS